MDREAFIRSLDAGTPEPFVSTDSPSTPPPPIALFPPLEEGAIAPRTQTALDEQTRAFNLGRQISERGVEPQPGLQSYIAQTQRPGIPLDVGLDETIGSPWVRMQVARRRTQDDQMAYLQQYYGKDKVRLDKDGDFIVEVPDPETGKPRDIKLNEESITLADLGALVTSSAPEIIGGLLALKGGRMIPGLGRIKGALGFLRDLTAGSIGSQAAGGLSEAEARLETGTPVKPMELAGERVGNVPFDLALGYLTAGLAKGTKGVFNFAQAPFSFARKDIQNEGLAAAERIAQKTGIDLLYDPGEATGFPGLIQSRAYLEAHPVGTSAQKAFRLAQDARVESFRDFLFGAAPSDEAAGQALINKLQEIRTRSDLLVKGAKESTATGAEARIRAGFGTGEQFPTQTGEKIRAGVQSKAASIKGQSNANFAKVYELPEATEAIIPTKPIAAQLKEIKAALPDREKIVETIQYDQYGNPSVAASTGREVVREFVPGEVERFVNAKLDPKMELNKLVQMRNLLWDRYIPEGESTPGISTRYLRQVSNSITQAIDEGVTALPDGELKKRLVKANDFYKKNVLKLNEAGIEDLFHTVEEGKRFVEPQEIVNRLKADPAKYLRTVDLLGKSSAEAEALRQSIRTDVLLKSTTGPGFQRIDGKKLLENLNALRTGKNTREIFDDVFGGSIGELSQQSTLLGAAQGTIPIEEAKAFLSSSSPSITQLNKIISRQALADKLLSNKLVADATKGELDTATVNPEKFVSSFYRTAKQSDLDQVMKWVHTDPLLERDIQRKTIENLFSEAGPKAKASTFEKILEDKTVSSKLQTVIGPDNWQLIQDYIRYEKPREFAAEVAGGTGMLVKGSAIGKLFRALPLVGEGSVNIAGEIEEVIKIKMLSTAMANPGIRKWLSSASSPSDFKDLAKAIAVSTPFLQAVAEDFPDAKGVQIINAVKQLTTPESTDSQAPAKSQIPRGDFERSLR